ncbi:hypothetical protein BJ741DRAFT_709531 [Chytriomyces cf. hyalinus JEL632]|nr:hypothetical protein BJ741DRAFT_709531 [Chytriomyces cf. hyalinus JEL632]
MNTLWTRAGRICATLGRATPPVASLLKAMPMRQNTRAYAKAAAAAAASTNTIPYETVQVIGVGPKAKSSGPVSIKAAHDMVKQAGSAYQLVLADANKVPPLCRIVLALDTATILAAAAQAQKYLSVPDEHRNVGLLAVTQEVRVISQTGSVVGVMPTKDALKLLKEGQDLILVGALPSATSTSTEPSNADTAKQSADETKERKVKLPQPPACKIVDLFELAEAVELGKRAYRARHATAPTTSTSDSAPGPAAPLPKNHKNQVKDIEVKSHITPNDLKIKMKKCAELLRKGYSVQIKLNENAQQNPKKVAVLLAQIKAGVTDAGVTSFDLTEIAKQASKEIPGAFEEEETQKSRYMLRKK